MTALLLVLDFLADVADLLLLDFLSGFTDLRSMHGVCWFKGLSRLRSCETCLGRSLLVPEFCLLAASGGPDAVLAAERLVAATMRAGAALIPEGLRAGTDRLSACRSAQTSKSLTGMPLLHWVAEELKGVCKGRAQLAPKAVLVGAVIMYKQSYAWIWGHIRRHETPARGCCYRKYINLDVSHKALLPKTDQVFSVGPER